jgi:hypothetical protein
MVVNRHGSFYMRSGWGTKIIDAVEKDDMIFSPNNEQAAVDTIGLGRVMIKALRYWSDVLGLTVEEKRSIGITKRRTELFELIAQYDRYYQRIGSLLLMHRNLARNKEDATAWYWAFNELKNQSFTKKEFVDGFHAFLGVNGVSVKRVAIEKEFNCFKNTYIGDDKFDRKTIMDEDTYPFLAPLHLLKVNDEKKYEKVSVTKAGMPLEILLYSIAYDNGNKEDGWEQKQISIDQLMEEKLQIGKYYNMKYSKLIEMLMEAENKKMLILSNNFGNRHIEMTDYPYQDLLRKYYVGEER